METNQLRLFKNFEQASYDSLYLDDEFAVQSHSESLERSARGLAYAVFIDVARPGVQLGGIESLQRFNRVKPECTPPQSGDEPAKSDMATAEKERWRTYCKALSFTNIHGQP